MKIIWTILLLTSLFQEKQRDPLSPKPVKVEAKNDSTYFIDINEHRIRVLFPNGVIVSKPMKYSGHNHTLLLSPSIKYDDFSVSEISFTKQQFVRNEEADFKKFIDGGGVLEGDSNPPETEEEFKHRKQLLRRRETGDYFNEFSTIQKRIYGHRRFRDEPCGCFVNESSTFINDLRIKVSITSNADSMSRKVEHALKIKMGSDFDYGDEYQTAVLDSLRGKFLSILSRIQFKKY